MVLNIGISTVYFNKKLMFDNKRWVDIKKELESLEINCLELNPDVSEEFVNELEKDVILEKIKVLSIHNFCPKINTIPKGKSGFNVYDFTSEDEQERSLAVKYTKKTIDLAKKMNCRNVVLHAGEVVTNPSGKEFYKYVLSYGINNNLYQDYKQQLMKSRSENKPKYFDLLLKTLDEVVIYASKENINLCLETRFFPNEIPNFDEVLDLLEHYKGYNVYYWHDFGHAEILNRLGFSKDHEEYFKNYKKMLKGYHIHDVIGLQDHFSPGNGEIDFGKNFRPELGEIFILEVHHKENLSSLIKGKKIIENIIKSLGIN